MIINPNTDKTLSEALEVCFEQFSSVLNCVKIGKILSFDKTKQTCNIEILHKMKNQYIATRNELLDYPELQDVPVVVMGGGGAYTSYPISAGDECVVLFNDYQKDGWQNTGEPAQTFIQRKHNIADPIAIVGLRSLPKAIQSYSDYLDLHYSDNSSIIVGETVEVNNSTINLNGDANVTGAVTAPTLNATDAATGTFVSSDSKTITVVNGIITAIS